MTTTADKMFEEWVEQYPIQIAGDDYEMCKDAWKAALAASAQQVECKPCGGMGLVDGIWNACPDCEGSGEVAQQVEGEAVANAYRYGTALLEPHDAPVGEPDCQPLYTHPTPPTSAAGMAGFKLLKDSTHTERAWIEDAGHENGLYSNTCIKCGREFAGHKRRVICRVCAAAPTQPAPTEGEQG